MTQVPSFEEPSESEGAAKSPAKETKTKNDSLLEGWNTTEVTKGTLFPKNYEQHKSQLKRIGLDITEFLDYVPHMSEKALKILAPDLANGEFPRSPRETLGGYVVMARTLDKCRAELVGTNGDYHFDCPLDNFFFNFAGISADDFKTFVATGADDDAVGRWISDNAKPRERREVIQWNNDMRCKRICEMPIELQEFLEGYIPEFIPGGKIVYYWFDVYDIEEGRI